HPRAAVLGPPRTRECIDDRRRGAVLHPGSTGLGSAGTLPGRGAQRRWRPPGGDVDVHRVTTAMDTAPPFQLCKLGHVVLNVTDLDASVRFYTELLGLPVSDRYADTMVPGGMVFLRFNPDHHGVALVGGARKSDGSSLNHFAFEVGSVDEVFRARDWLVKHGVKMVFEGRRRAGCQIAVEFEDPDG